MTARAGSSLDGKLWTEQVNRLLAIKREIEAVGDEKKATKKLASGWGFFKMNKTG